MRFDAYTATDRATWHHKLLDAKKQWISGGEKSLRNENGLMVYLDVMCDQD